MIDDTIIGKTHYSVVSFTDEYNFETFREEMIEKEKEIGEIIWQHIVNKYLACFTHFHMKEDVSKDTHIGIFRFGNEINCRIELCFKKNKFRGYLFIKSLQKQILFDIKTDRENKNQKITLDLFPIGRATLGQCFINTFTCLLEEATLVHFKVKDRGQIVFRLDALKMTIPEL